MQYPATMRDRVSAEEWQARVELAALYRLVALYGWDDAIFTHLSLRVPGNDRHFLINQYGLFFEEMTASSLVKIDLDGNLVDPTPQPVNKAGFVIHSALHIARDDAHCVMHLHSVTGVAVAAQRNGLRPISQTALIVLPDLAYHDYEGIALDLDERQRIVADLGSKNMMLLRNHGTLAVGPTVAATWLRMYLLERACAQQVAAQSGGSDALLDAPDAAREEVARVMRGPGAASTPDLAWAGFLRKLDRVSPGYRD
ncbi:class II aldolase/adducin family protein [Roseiterribacter gracilis]|uniref:Class II aldolase n=1 Tax=Roseiterribacter gracilis TaxID=2812848 RepID=A0A8S8XBJ0_9PROT|nr:class II aldolase [Rhodospirillales bacterium TMPK1]